MFWSHGATPEFRPATADSCRSSRAVRTGSWAGLLALGLGALAAPAGAAPQLRFQIELRGNFELLGNTLAQECSTDDTGTLPVPAPLIGSLDCTGTGDPDDTSPDVFWRADAPSAGQALADATVGAEAARSSAELVLPAGAQPLYGRLYWAGLLQDASGLADASVELTTAGERFDIASDASATVTNDIGYWYQSSADVTRLLVDHGPGVFRVGGVGSLDLPALATPNEQAVVAWWMVVMYALETEPTRHLALFDGLDLVENGSAATAVLAGLSVPEGGFEAALGVVAYEGESAFSGDALLLDGVALSDTLNPVDDFFNSTRSKFGAPVSNAGDLPRLTGGVRSMSGIDLDVLDVSSRFAPGQESVTLSAESTSETFLLGAFITSVSSLNPDFGMSTKSFVDVDAGVVARGDEIEYTLLVQNGGSDASVGTELSDALPVGVSYTPGTLSVTQAGEALTLSDVAGDDIAEFDAETRTVRFRLGAGADQLSGGALEVGETVRLKFRVTVDADAPNEIANQATVRGAGRAGTLERSFLTDADADQPGAQATRFDVAMCEGDADCRDPLAPVCVTPEHRCACPAATLGCPPDRDGDGLLDDNESRLGTDPLDSDTDDDGLLDADEREPGADTDGDGLTNGNDADSDGDGIYDGTESGRSCYDAAALATCVPDADQGVTTTDPLNADSDGGGAADGTEDENRNGRVDDGEADPNSAGDDRCLLVPDACVPALVPVPVSSAMLQGSGLGCGLASQRRGHSGELLGMVAVLGLLGASRRRARQS